MYSIVLSKLKCQGLDQYAKRKRSILLMFYIADHSVSCMQKIISLVLILLTRSGKREKTTFVVFIGTFVQSHGSSELPASATVHLESSLVREINPLVRERFTIERENSACSAYWKQGITADGFKVEKQHQSNALTAFEK